MNERETISNLSIEDIGSEGNGIGRSNGKVVFVPGTVPGDVVDTAIFRSKKNFSEGTILQIVQRSEARATPFCEHYGACGGCKWQHIAYPHQLAYKRRIVQEAFRRIGGGIPVPEIPEVLPSPLTTCFRNKLEFTFSSHGWTAEKPLPEANPVSALGFHAGSRWDRVLDITHCHLQEEPSNAIRLAVKAYALEYGLSFFNLRKQEGFLRNLIIRTTGSGGVMAILSIFRDDPAARNGLLGFLKEKFPGLTSLMYVVNPRGNDSIAGLATHTFSGNDHLLEKTGRLEFRIGPTSFFQTNTRQAGALYEKVTEFVGLQGHETVYDLYCGTGTIACYVAGTCKKAVGIEHIAAAVSDAEANAEHNHIPNAFFHAGDVKDTLNDDFISAHGKPDVVITDPARPGMHPAVVRRLLEMQPGKIVYVSCNPATQARDAALLSELYDVAAIQPVDMFPHSPHVENVLLMVRRTKA